MKPVIIIPTLNPDQRLVNLVEKLNEVDNPIVIINDGSEEECSDIFETLSSRFQCDIVNHEKNMGKGAAIKTGIKYVSRIYPESSGIVTADGDGQHAAEDILRVAKALHQNQGSLILGSRDFSEKDVPFKSRWGNRITSIVFKLSTGKECPDTQTGLRGIPKELKEICLSVSGDRFEYEMNTLLEFVGHNIPLRHITIETIYLENNKSSHFNPVKDSIRIYSNILKYSFSKYSKRKDEIRNEKTSI